MLVTSYPRTFYCKIIERGVGQKVHRYTQIKKEAEKYFFVQPMLSRATILFNKVKKCSNLSGLQKNLFFVLCISAVMLFADFVA